MPNEGLTDTTDQISQGSSLKKYLPAYQVRMGLEYMAPFDDLRDAIAAGKLLKQDYPTRSVAVVDTTQGFLVIDLD